MSIVISKHSNETRISLLGEKFLPRDVECWQTAMGNISVEPVSVSIYDARVLPAVIMADLLRITNKRNHFQVKVKVVHRILSGYLARIGIPHSLIEVKNVKISKSLNCKAICLGGSAGSLDSIVAIIEQLPQTTVPVFVVQHIPEDTPNYLPSILRSKTSLTVKDAEDEEKVVDSTVYIAPPAKQMRVVKGKIVLTDEPPAYFARPSIDILFESLGVEYKSGLIAVLLSGYNNDGTHCLKLLQQLKSKMIIQDPIECLEKDLLVNAINTGNYNYIFPLPEVVSYVARHAALQNKLFTEKQMVTFLGEINDKYGYDFREYSYESLSRLINKEMADKRLSNFADLRQMVLEDYNHFESLFLEFSVNVTSFFRNPEVYKVVRKNIVSYLASYPHIKIWCAGCSTGEEPYSLAILLKEEGLLEKSQIYATDINPFVVEQARNGYFSQTSLDKAEENYKNAGGKLSFGHFSTTFDGAVQIDPDLAKHILFFQHSLLSQGVLNQFNLIFCRNVLIYFQKSLQDKVFDLFSNSLIRNGFLVLGEAETIGNHHAFSVYDKQLKIYRHNA